MKTFFAQPLVTEKSMALAGNNVYQFVVPVWANKKQIAEHIAKHFSVTVEAVNTANFKPRSVYFRRKPGTQSGFKKASVHLKKGEGIAAFALPVEENAADAQKATENAEVKTKKTENAAKTESKITVRSKSKK